MLSVGGCGVPERPSPGECLAWCSDACTPPLGHAKEALSLAQMQEQTLQLEHQAKLKVVRVGAGGCGEDPGRKDMGEDTGRVQGARVGDGLDGVIG